VPIGSGVAGQAVARGEPLLVEDASADPRFASAASERYESSSFVVMPLGLGPDRFGALCATDRRGGARFGEEDVALLRLLGLALSPLLDPTHPLLLDDPPAGSDAASLGLGELLEPVASEAPRSDLDADLARAVCGAMTAELEPERVLASSLQAIADSLTAAPVSVYLLDGPNDALRREAQWDAGGAGDRASLPRRGGLTGAVFEGGEPLASEQPDADARFDAAIDTPESGARGPLLVLPLRFRGKTLGVFRAFAPGAGATSPRTQEVLGAALSAAVRNVLLYRSLVESIEEVAQVRRESAQSE